VVRGRAFRPQWHAGSADAHATIYGYVPEEVIVADRVAAELAHGLGGPSRRAVLAASSASLPLLLAACKGVQALGSPPPPAADVTTLRAAISAEEIMVARYAAAVSYLRTSLPPKGTPADIVSFSDIEVVQSQHAEHLAQLKSRLVEPPGSKPTPSPTPSVQVTGTLSDVLSTLELAEQAASDRLLGQLGVLPGALAQLFASIAASEATHVPLLRAAGQGR
jgi:hypothetical protein